MPRARRPCSPSPAMPLPCPWRKDTAGDWVGRYPPRLASHEFGDACGTPGNEVGLHAPTFMCHKSQSEGRRILCAGWLVQVGRDHLGVRLAVAADVIPAADLTAGPDWPDLFTTYDDMLAALFPDVAARREDTPDAPARPVRPPRPALG